MRKETFIGKWTSISIPDNWKPQISQICKVRRYASISEFVREAIREKLKKEVGIK